MNAETRQLVAEDADESPKAPEQDKRRRHVVAPKPLSAHGFSRHASSQLACRGFGKCLIAQPFSRHRSAATRLDATLRTTRRVLNRGRSR
jgi:hypothetical protein